MEEDGERERETNLSDAVGFFEGPQIFRGTGDLTLEELQVQRGPRQTARALLLALLAKNLSDPAPTQTDKTRKEEHADRQRKRKRRRKREREGWCLSITGWFFRGPAAARLLLLGCVRSTSRSV